MTGLSSINTTLAGVAQSVERVALITAMRSPQGRGFEPLLRLFLYQRSSGQLFFCFLFEAEMLVFFLAGPCRTMYLPRQSIWHRRELGRGFKTCYRTHREVTLSSTCVTGGQLFDVERIEHQLAVSLLSGGRAGSGVVSIDHFVPVTVLIA
jgi:hypothetical protein